MSLDKYKNMSDEEFKQLSNEEFQDYIKLKKEDFSRHYRKINEITVDVVLKPEEVIAITKQYHKKSNLDGVVNEDIHQLFFDEAYTFKIDKENRNNNDVRPAWRVLVDLPEPLFLWRTIH